MAEFRKHVPLQETGDREQKTEDGQNAGAERPVTDLSSVLGHLSSDLEILAPDVTITLEGEEITARELTFGETLKHWEALAAVTGALAGAAGRNDPDALLKAFAACREEVMTLVSVATGKPPAFIENLRPHEAEGLLAAFWRANQHFFLRRLVAELARASQAGAKSSPPSSGTVTGGAN